MQLNLQWAGEHAKTDEGPSLPSRAANVPGGGGARPSVPDEER